MSEPPAGRDWLRVRRHRTGGRYRVPTRDPRIRSPKINAGRVSEWFKEPVLKTGEPKGSVGSNPTPTVSDTIVLASRIRLKKGRARRAGDKEALMRGIAWCTQRVAKIDGVSGGGVVLALEYGSDLKFVRLFQRCF